MERIHFLRALERDLKNCGIDVMAVAQEVLGRSALVLVVVLTEGHNPRYVQCGRSCEA